MAIKDGPQDPVSGIPRMSGDGNPMTIEAVLRDFMARPIPALPSDNWDRPPEKTSYQRFVESLGQRHRQATLENFRPPNIEAQKVLDAVLEYREHLIELIRKGTNLLLLGSAGTGKDHLLIGLGKVASSKGYYVKLLTGPELFRTMRDAMSDGHEALALDALRYPAILILSDPLPPVGALTPYQASCLYDILDFRWQRRMPTWCSVNVSSSEEADQRLGAVITDRLQDGAVVLRLTWPSYRKPRSII